MCLQAALVGFLTTLPYQASFESACHIIEIEQHHGDLHTVQPTLLANKYQYFGIDMTKLRKQKCSDDRDRVCALNGLKTFYYYGCFLELTDNNDFSKAFTTVDVDYNKPTFEVYRE
jgi:hypothetical protein